MAEIGASLREARMRARIDISEVEARTMIRAKYLRALENEEWGLLPGPVYVKSFLKTYGDYLGLDSRLLVDEFKRRYERPSDGELHASSPSARERQRQRPWERGGVRQALFSPAGAIVAALIVVVAVLYVIGRPGASTTPGHAGITPAAGGGHHGNGGAHGAHAHKQGSGGSGSTGATTSTRTTGGTTTGATSTGPQTTIPPGRATLALVATSRVWVCVMNAAGKTLHVGTYTPGEKIPTASANTLLVGFGNPGVTITANGKPYTPQATSTFGLKITPKGVSLLTPLPLCGE